MEQSEQVAKAFVEHYYTTFDTNRSNLRNLYQENSLLTFEGQKFIGGQNIVSKLASLPFDQCKHSISTTDCQPSGPNGSLVVFVSGILQLAGEQHPLKFSQKDDFYTLFGYEESERKGKRKEGEEIEMFHLVPTPQGSFYVQNDIFRLNYA
ncbi:Nuclear transport factor 2B [Bienertia sinuspersici]